MRRPSFWLVCGALLCCQCRKSPLSSTPPSGDADAGELRIRAAAYAQDCAADSDCIEVYEGDVCAACGPCRGGAIATRAEADYRRDLSALRERCPPTGPLDFACKPCGPPEASCVKGRCVAGRAPSTRAQ